MENLGFGRACNIALKKAKGKYVLIYNDDAFLEKDTIGIMVDKMESDNSIGSLQGLILFYDRKKIVESAGSYLTNLGALVKKEGYKVNLKKENEREVLSANLPMMRMSVLKKTGFFDDDYFLYFEEADLSWRIWLAGYRVVYYPEAILYHARGITTDRVPRPPILESTYKNRIDSLMKNLELKNLIWMIPQHLALCLAGILIFILKGKFREAWAIFKGTIIPFFEIRKIIAKRRIIQKSRKISDQELLPKIFRMMDAKSLLKGAGMYLKW
jgi:GT2 family glycosyltransferase